MPETGLTTKNRGGAPLGNKNSQRHGLRGASLPKACKYIEYSLQAFRRSIESAVLANRGEIDLPSAALVNSSCRHERRCQLLERWLRKGMETLPLSDRLAILKDLSSATDARDKCLKMLSLTPEHVKRDAILSLYADPLPADDPEDLIDTQSAPEATPAREGGEA